MGGINHQPCGEYMDLSTEMSMRMSSGRAHFELGNVALEQAILVELSGGTGNKQSIIEHLEGSLDALTLMHDTVSKLRTRMKERNYRDLPVHNFNPKTLGANLVELGAVGKIAWGRVVAKKGFSRCLDEIESLVKALQERQRTLLDAIGKAGSPLDRVLEENREGNFRLQFAQSYRAWGNLQSFFLASALMSTERWYAFMGYGSLVTVTPQILVPPLPATVVQ